MKGFALLLLVALAALALPTRSAHADTPHARIAFVPETSYENPPALCVMDVDDIATACPLPSQTDVDDFFIAWSPRGTMIALKQLVYQGGQGGVPLTPVSQRVAVVAADQADHLPNGQASPEFLANTPFLLDSSSKLGPPMWSNDSRQVASLDQRGAIVIADLDGRNVQTLDLGAKAVLDAAWSPDSKYFAVGRDDPAGNGIALVVVDAQTGAQQTLLHFDSTVESSALIWDISWSRDSKHILLSALLPSAADDGRNWLAQIWIVDMDRKNAQMLYATSTDNAPLEASFSSDGELIAFDGYSGNVTNIFLMNSDGSDVRQLTHSKRGAYRPRFGPDGRVLYSDEDTNTMSVITFDPNDPEHDSVKTLVHAIAYEWASAPGPLPSDAVTPTPTATRKPTPVLLATPSGNSIARPLTPTPASLQGPNVGSGPSGGHDRLWYGWLGLVGVGALVGGLVVRRAVLRGR